MLDDLRRPPLTLERVAGFVGNGLNALVARCLEATGGPAKSPEMSIARFREHYAPVQLTHPCERVEPMLQPQPAWPATDTPEAQRPGVLVVDDDRMTLELVQLVLPACGFRVWTASGPDEALGLLSHHMGDIDAAVLDARMPGCSGPGLLTLLRQEWGDLPAVFIAVPWELDLPGLAEAPVLPKPFNGPDLARLVRQEMDRKDHQRCGG